MIRQAEGQLAYHFIIVDAVNRGFRRVHGQLVGLLLRQEGVFDFDQVFTAQLVGRQVQADGDALVGGGQLEQRQQLKPDLCRNMVNHRAALDRFNLQFVIVSHDGSPLKSQICV